MKNEKTKSGKRSTVAGLFVVALAWLLAPIGLSAATVTSAPWGKDSAGDPVDLYTITLPHAEVKVTTYGARIVSISVPDRDGKIASVVIGYDSVDGYLNGRTSIMGSTVGRYANRIAGGQFTLDGNTYHIPKNSGNNALHGGTIGFDKKVWTAKVVRDGVEMTLASPDGDMGFPGNLAVHVTFTLAMRHGNPALTLAYQATTDKPTVVNFTNHSFFNLSGDPQQSVLDDDVIIRADSFTPADNSGIPTGKIQPVEGTPNDFRTEHTFGEHASTRGYDVNFVLRPKLGNQPVAEVRDPKNGRFVQVFTDQPGMELWVPLFPAAAGRSAQGSFSLETQHYPDAPNQPNFPSTTLLPGKTFNSKTIYVFGASTSK